MKTVSVIVPVYNVEKYLEQCIKSILAQTYKNIELVLVDDGSTDNSGKICDAYALTDGRVKVVHQKNQGCVIAFETGIKNCTADYVTRVDSDDILNIHFIENCMYALETTNADMARGLAQLLTDKIDYTEEMPIVENTVILKTQKEKLDELVFNYQGPLVPLTKTVYKKHVLLDNYCPNVRVNEDEWLIHKYILKCNAIAEVNLRMYYYRINQTGMTQNFSLNYFSGVQAVVDRIECVKNAKVYDYLIPKLYERLLLKSIDYYNLCKNKRLNCKKQIKTIRKLLKKAFSLNYKLNKSSVVFSRKEILVLWLFPRSFFLFDKLSAKFKVFNS